MRAVLPSRGFGLQDEAVPMLQCVTLYMKMVRAKIEENRKEEPSSEPDKDTNTWLIEGKFYEGIPYWETAHLGFQDSEIEAEIVEGSVSGPATFTLRTRGKSPLKKGDVIDVDVRNENEA
jgi:hypothetical protein